MKYKRRIMEVSLLGVELTTGRKRKAGKHLAAARLVYPRPGIAERVAVKPVQLKAGRRGRGATSWSEQILFKEVVQGPFALSVELTDAMTDSELGKVIDSLASAVLKVAGNEMVDAAAGPMGGVLMGLPVRFFSAMMSKKEVPKVLGSGSVDLCADGRWASGKTRKVKIELTAEKDVYEIRRSTRGGSPRMARKRVLKAGEISGSVTLAILPYD